MSENNKLTKLQIDRLEILLKEKLSIEDDPIGRKVIKHYFKEIQSGSPTIIGDAFATIQDIRRVIHDNGNSSMILDHLKNENDVLRRKLLRLKNSKPKTYKYMVRNSLGNANFNVNKLASYLNNSSVSNLAIDEFLNTATQQLIDLIHILGVNNEK